MEKKVQPEDKPDVHVKPHSYQPSQTELDEDVSLDASPEDVIRAAFSPANVIEEPLKQDT